MTTIEKQQTVEQQRRAISMNRVVIAFSILGIALCSRYILKSVAPMTKTDQKN